MDKLRIDKWLWAARFYKTRSLAVEELDKGRVRVNDIEAKPSREVKAGDTVALRQGPVIRTLVVLGISSQRGPAPVAQQLYAETEESLQLSQVELDQRVRERTAELADANIHLMEAQRLANLGSWSWEVVSNRINWSERLYDIYGLAPDKFGGTLPEFIGLIHPDDRAMVPGQHR